MTAPKKTAARPSRSRAQVKEEFADLAERAGSVEALDPKTVEATRARHDQVRTAVQAITVDTVLEDAVKLKLNTARALDSVTEQLVTKTAQLKDVTEAIEIKSEELSTLHKIDLAATAIDILIQEHAEKTDEFTKEVAERRAAWAKEESDRRESLRAQSQALDIERTREKNEYEYNKTQERKKKEDEFTQKDILQTRSLADRKAALEKEWAETSAQLETQRLALVQEKAVLVAEHEKIVSDLKRDNAIAINAAKRDAADQVKEIQASAAADKRLFDVETKNLRDQLSQRDAQLLSMATELAEARKSVQEISQKAIDGAAQKDAFQNFLATTREQNNGQAAGKRSGS